MMLVPSNVLSTENKSLTREMAQWVLGNALGITDANLRVIRDAASSPMLNDSTLFEELPIEVAAAFAMEPYFPRRLFNRTFAWLFGVESIEQINADAISHHAQKIKTDAKYVLRKVDSLQFTQEEYEHVFNEFNSHPKSRDDFYIRNNLGALISHRFLTRDMHLSVKDTDVPCILNQDVNKELADGSFDDVLKSEIEFWVEMGELPTDSKIIHGVISELSYSNLSQDRRDALIPTDGFNKLKMIDLCRAYNDEIPDDVMRKALQNGLIMGERLLECSFLIRDERVPEAMAAKEATKLPEYFAGEYILRKDISSAQRSAMLEKLKSTLSAEYSLANKDLDNVVTGTRTLIKLIESGALSHDEIKDVIELDVSNALRNAAARWGKESGIEFPREFQDMLISTGFTCSEMAEVHYDINAIIETFEDRYVKQLNFEQYWGVMGSSFLSNPNWTTDALIKLADLFKQQPALDYDANYAFGIRRDISKKLLGERLYPAILGGYQLPQGEAEKIIINLLDEKNLLGDEDVALISQADIDVTYCQDGASLPEALMNHHELNEAIVAHHLTRRLGEMPEAPALATTRRSMGL